MQRETIYLFIFFPLVCKFSYAFAPNLIKFNSTIEICLFATYHVVVIDNAGANFGPVRINSHKDKRHFPVSFAR